MLQQEYEGEIREIIAKAICAKGKKRFVKEFELRPDHRPEEILGYWVGNHRYSAKSFHDSVVITGRYDITVWYSFEDHSKTDLCKKTFDYREQIALGEVEGRLEKDEEVLVCERLEPRCNFINIAGENIKLGVETAFTVDIVGEAKMIVVAYSASILGDEEDEDYDEEINEDEYADEEEQDDEYDDGDAYPGGEDAEGTVDDQDED